MEQLKLFLEKAKTDKELMAKLDVLSAKKASDGEIIALAAEYGFTFTKEDIESLQGESSAPVVKLTESDLEAVAGGFPTVNRWDSVVCGSATMVIPDRCKAASWYDIRHCDHHRTFANAAGKQVHICVMGRYSYIGSHYGTEYREDYK